jgi:hypothetical protein
MSAKPPLRGISIAAAPPKAVNETFIETPVHNPSTMPT